MPMSRIGATMADPCNIQNIKAFWFMYSIPYCLDIGGVIVEHVPTQMINLPMDVYFVLTLW